MRFQKLLTPTFLLAAISSFGQIEVELSFKNPCNDSIVKLEYSLHDIINGGEYILSENSKAKVPKESTYHLNVSVPNGDYVGMYDSRITVKGTNKHEDTLLIPKIKFTGSAALHSQFWSYFNCDNVCNGKQIEYYPNGTKRLEGEFLNGKPKWIVQFRADGTKEFESWYKVGNIDSDRLNKYDDAGQLDEYVIKKFKHRRTIALTYDTKDKLLDKEVFKHTIERWR